MSFQYVDDWLSSTLQVITGLSNDEIKSIVESPIPPVSHLDDRIHYSFHDFPHTPDSRHQEDKHPRSGKTYLGESKAQNVSAPLRTANSLGILSHSTTHKSAPLKPLAHQSWFNVSLIEDISKLSIDDSKENGVPLSETLHDFDETTPHLVSEDDGYYSDEGDEDFQDEDPCSLILDEDPQYKLIPMTHFTSTGTTSEHPLLQFNENDEAVVFYKDIRSIEDHTWLPRTFQNHRLTLAQFHRPDGFRYMKNSKCPKSPTIGEEFADGSRSKSTYAYAEASHLENFVLHHYLRTFNLNKRKVELLCRFCRGKNWVPKTKYDTHLALSHGILQLPNEKLPFLLPYPQSMFKNKSGQFVTYSVECPHCNKWIRLGQPVDGPNAPELKHQGLFFNYFAHFIINHKDYVEC